eukprot:scaffold5231_cov83-Cylindrotheca_fusiformis.AAC.4
MTTKDTAAIAYQSYYTITIKDKKKMKSVGGGFHPGWSRYCYYCCYCFVVVLMIFGSVQSFQHHHHQFHHDRRHPMKDSTTTRTATTMLSASTTETETTTTTTSSSSSSSSSSFDPNYYMPAENSIHSAVPAVPVAQQQQRQQRQQQRQGRVTLTRFLSQFVKDHPEYKTLKNIYLAVQMACKTISRLVNRAGLVLDTTTNDNNDNNDDYSDGRFYSTVQMVIPEAKMDSERPEEHQPGVLIAYDDYHLACLDPMDGSGNADASICTGTIFGVFDRPERQQQQQKKDNDDTTTTTQMNKLESILQPARNMRAAGYCIYSSATVLVLTLGEGVYGFTLDPQINEFVLTHENVTIPSRGSVYSCNEANSEGWNNNNNSGWKEYLRTIKLGQGQSKEPYAHRYVGSMVGDIHRTLLYGGIFAYPSSEQKKEGNLQLLYKTSPLAFVIDQAGGMAMDEDGNDLLDKKPKRIHQKSPCFMGSPLDMIELQSYLQR